MDKLETKLNPNVVDAVGRFVGNFLSKDTPKRKAEADYHTYSFIIAMTKGGEHLIPAYVEVYMRATGRTGQTLEFDKSNVRELEAVSA